ncbi:hypothetical protein F5Y16DRAFT_71684 [Xylariaceae sp. FL0255]|nr:hypothetical protein F5Y16DRAFT_71684 [Xylariaceae sp. FL0255]
MNKISAKMKTSNMLAMALALASGYGVSATALHTTAVTINPVGDGPILTPENNFNGWINPEDLAPMPQCIAQQNHTIWLGAMTRCTSQRCTSWFGVICTHKQWLTELSCLSEGFSPDVVGNYLPYCDRSVLAKAQLSQWIHNITGRTWLVEVGDTNGLEHLSPASLARGYADVNVMYTAPTCLTSSLSALSAEPFQHVIGSCRFTANTQHTGNAARPWEYSASLKSMIALDSVTAGYNNLVTTRRRIDDDADYFDKECFCGAFTIDPEKKETCLDHGSGGQLDLTKEWLWMSATCGSKSLPDNWTDMVKSTGLAYIPTESWHWPQCFVAGVMPNEVQQLSDECKTDACELDSNGYCSTVKRAIDRACICRSMSYDFCPVSSCHEVFEARIDYMNWLHDLCGSIPDWHGLPDNWRQSATIMPQDMIPWRWTVKMSSNDSNTKPDQCASYQWKLGSIVLVNLATILAVFLSLRASDLTRIVDGFILKATLMVAVQLTANLFNAATVQNTPGFQNVPVIELMLLWISMPRPMWLAVLMIGMYHHYLPLETRNSQNAVSAVAGTFVLTECVLQAVTSICMLMTVNYGVRHSFYFGALQGAEEGATAARIMYAAAAMWLAVSCLVVVQTIRILHRGPPTKPGTLDSPKWQQRDTPRVNINASEAQMPLMSCQRGNIGSVYGTFSDVKRQQGDKVWYGVFLSLPTMSTIVPMILLWIAQWLFWGGFLSLSSETFCPPHLVVLTTVWSVSSVVGVALGATW